MDFGYLICFLGFIYLDCLDGDDILFWGMCDLCLVTLLSPHTSFLLFPFQYRVSTHSTHVLLLFGCVEMGANNNNTQLYICTHTACCFWDVDVFLLRLCCLGIVCSHILICCHLFVLGFVCGLDHGQWVWRCHT